MTKSANGVNEQNRLAGKAKVASHPPTPPPSNPILRCNELGAEVGLGVDGVHKAPNDCFFVFSFRHGLVNPGRNARESESEGRGRK